MDSQDASWKAVADAKRAAILTAIPEEWQLAHLPSPQEVPDVTGDFIQQYLTPQKIKITEADAVKITKNTSSGQWTAVEVTEAFCHRAALAHQMVG
ncbi:hypothetical protein EYZ11_005856 [Aspergillus tanneri]|uniref:Uncharacterized protein n=1 Tax=Aspergillus tanneri TaxID=1220188 RepID=A0A4S3JMV7_9EURO|nr:hypothetical protein EYZ11_005856 [Aspergillus tanneri]